MIRISRADILSLALRICTLVSPTLILRWFRSGWWRGSDVRRQGIWVEGFIVRHLEGALFLLSLLLFCFCSAGRRLIEERTLMSKRQLFLFFY
jgi:hypothetical protein